MDYKLMEKTETYYKLLEECNKTFECIKEEFCEDLDDWQLQKFNKFNKLPDQLKVFIYAHNIYGRAAASKMLMLDKNEFNRWYERYEDISKFKTHYKRMPNKQEILQQ